MRHLRAFGMAVVLAGLSFSPSLAISILDLPLMPRADTSCPASAVNAATPLQVDVVRQKLTHEGVDFDQVEIWGGCVRVFVKDSAGNNSMVYFGSFDPLLVLY